VKGEGECIVKAKEQLPFDYINFTTNTKVWTQNEFFDYKLSFYKNYVLYIFFNTLQNTFNENIWIKLNKYILKSTNEFWPFKKVFKCSLSLRMISLIRIFIPILIIQLVAKYYQTNNLITQDLWIHLQLLKN
jgi:hypothetical protein